MESSTSLAVVIVTFNRCDDLRITLERLASMQDEFQHLVVIDNCSTDATSDMLREIAEGFKVDFHVRKLDENTGGAGGFHHGLEAALQFPADWIWMSDDDAVPQQGCLRAMIEAADDDNNTYGSVAVFMDGERETLCWPAPSLDDKGRSTRDTIDSRAELQPIQEVAMLPFLGFMVSRKKALEVGLPNRNYFISGDDVEYCLRLQASGSKLLQVRDSVVVHPPIPRYFVKVFNRRISCLYMPAWRRYYDIRNRIWNSRLSGGIPRATLTAAVLLPRLVFTFIHEKELSGQVGAYMRGIWDGLFRHDKSRSTEPAG